MPVIAHDHEDWRASPLFRLMRLLGMLLFAVLGAYWVIFTVWSLEKVITGGPQAVLAWYEHQSISMRAGPDGTFYISQWSAARFLMEQSVLLGITVGLWFAVRRRPRKA